MAYIVHEAITLQKHQLKREEMKKKAIKQWGSSGELLVPFTMSRSKDSSQHRSRVHLIAAGPLGCLGRRLAGRTSDYPVEYPPCHYW